jgi:UDP-N-acetyl-D-mannosaminuronate dehydrogenase
MSANEAVIVAGIGEVGRPLLHLLSTKYHCVGVDVEPVKVEQQCSVLHICYPYQISDFLGTTVAYVDQYKPRLVVINSTVPPGTTRALQDRVQVPVVFSAVRGKHVKMEVDMMRYKKFVAGFDAAATSAAVDHFAGAGFKVGTFRTPEVAELSKLVETTWLGLLIGWAQDIERMAAECGASYDEVNQFIQEIDFLPSHVFPGIIGGHCVMPNIKMLQARFSSQFLTAIVESNAAKQRQKQKTADAGR